MADLAGQPVQLGYNEHVALAIIAARAELEKIDPPGPEILLVGRRDPLTIPGCTNVPATPEANAACCSYSPTTV
jgi:hypothetical protein